MLNWRRWLLMGCMFGSLTLASLSQAQNQSVKVMLSDIEKIKMSEQGGDELYFSITEYSSVERPNQNTIPSYPTHWLAKHLENVEDVVLWEKELKDDESVMVVISLIERDAPPWNVDDLIGTIKFQVSNKQGKLEKAWKIPNREEVGRLDPNENIFELKGDGANYKIGLEVEVLPTTHPAVAR